MLHHVASYCAENKRETAYVLQSEQENNNKHEANNNNNIKRRAAPRPHVAVQHAKAAKHNGKLYINKKDLSGISSLEARKMINTK